MLNLKEMAYNFVKLQKFLKGVWGGVVEDDLGGQSFTQHIKGDKIKSY